MASMTGKERLLAAIAHEEPDRVPVSPRVQAWLRSEYGDSSLTTQLRVLPDIDPMHIVDDGTPNYIDTYPDDYVLPHVRVEQRRTMEDGFTVVSRTFHTPAGDLSDVTRIPPDLPEYGVSPNPVKVEHLIKEAADIEALSFLLPPANTDFSHVRDAQEELGERGVVMVCVRSALDHQAGWARAVEDLMVDYHIDRALFDRLLRLFHERSLSQVRAALEDGVEFIFGSWYFTSLSVGWSPAMFSEVFAPMIREHVEVTHGYDAVYDYYDDGVLNQTMEVITDCGVDVLETCTPPPVGDFDLTRAKQTIGTRTCLKGYVDLLYVVQMGTPELVESTVRDAMEVGKPGGGFIIGSSDSFREGTPAANIEAYFRACRAFGDYR
ncbi:MAG: hypothetical protein HN712_14685 [Gemmatimonadetes bacterium]|nr:hypothetical protein [Gemmatimonadota bacterium]MBT6147339.1 hypothetical protein [Gemmatimonadota bacterium]MBT7861564.1 hypothetical protein [Gemmatimonadota bacterium]